MPQAMPCGAMNTLADDAIVCREALMPQHAQFWCATVISSTVRQTMHEELSQGKDWDEAGKQDLRIPRGC